MPNLDDLVKLASLGTSGICIFGIFWTGWLIKASSTSENTLFHSSLHKYMTMVVAVAIISGVSGIANAYIKQSQIENLKQDNIALQQERNALITNREVELAKAGEAQKSLRIILESKEAYQLRNPNQELKTHIDLLKGFLKAEDPSNF